MIDIIEYRRGEAQPKLDAIFSRGWIEDSEVLETVKKIIKEVRELGDEALFFYTQTLDGITVNELSVRVEQGLIDEMAHRVPESLAQVVREAIKNVRVFHERQAEHSWSIREEDGVELGMRIAPIPRVGLYVPGGSAAYPSSLIMNAVPAQIAGVPRIVVVTPPGSLMSSPLIAVAIRELGLHEVYTVGGAQAIAALAFGTQSIPRVDKIAGPGNSYVATAKRLLFGIVGIDQIAGPSEVVILADESVNPVFVAADMLAQAEHDPRASAVCVTPSRQFAEEVARDLEVQLETLDRKAIAEESLKRYGAIVVVDSLDAGCELINEMAPEHAELMTEDAEQRAALITAAGAIFIGQFSPEAVGDYFAGPNHVLPTGRTARYGSPLGVYDFVKRTSIIRYSAPRLITTAAQIMMFATAEGLAGHARSIQVRLPRDPDDKGTGAI